MSSEPVRASVTKDRFSKGYALTLDRYHNSFAFGDLMVADLTVIQTAVSEALARIEAGIL